MFRHRRQLRSWAARVLVLWLFGICAGVANACLASPALQADSESAGMQALQAASAQAEHTHTNGLSHDHEADAPDHGAGNTGQHGASLKSNCTDFCDKASASLPSSKSASNDVQTHALQSIAVAVIVTFPAFEPVQQWVPRRDGVRAPPIPIAFLRLAL